MYKATDAITYLIRELVVDGRLNDTCAYLGDADCTLTTEACIEADLDAARRRLSETSPGADARATETRRRPGVCYTLQRGRLMWWRTLMEMACDADDGTG